MVEADMVELSIQTDEAVTKEQDIQTDVPEDEQDKVQLGIEVTTM